jgi:hypothetical protein
MLTHVQVQPQPDCVIASVPSIHAHVCLLNVVRLVFSFILCRTSPSPDVDCTYCIWDICDVMMLHLVIAMVGVLHTPFPEANLVTTVYPGRTFPLNGRLEGGVHEHSRVAVAPSGDIWMANSGGVYVVSGAGLDSGFQAWSLAVWRPTFRCFAAQTAAGQAAVKTVLLVASRSHLYQAAASTTMLAASAVTPAPAPAATLALLTSTHDGTAGCNKSGAARRRRTVRALAPTLPLEIWHYILAKLRSWELGRSPVYQSQPQPQL